MLSIYIVQEAISRKVTVKAFGARHSQTDIICTEGIPVDMHGLRSFQINSDNVTATVGAGVTVRDATVFLRENGRALRNVPGFGNITIGGAVGTGAHGSTIRYNASISSQVVALWVVNGTGQLQYISDPEDLNSFRVSLGLLGIIVNVTLYTVPLYKTRAFQQVIVANWTIVDVNTEGNAFTYDHTPSSYDYTTAVSAQGKEIAFNLISTACGIASTLGYTILHVFEFYLQSALLYQTIGYVPIYTEDGVTIQNPAVGFYDLMFSPVCQDVSGPSGLVCIWDHGGVNGNVTVLDNEFGIALDDLPEFIGIVKDIITYNRDTVHFEFYVWKRTDPYNDASGSLAGYQTILQTLTKTFEARSHWGKSGLVYHNREYIDLKLDSDARRHFVNAMNKFDPNEVFINNYGRRIKETTFEVDTDPLTVHCALLDNCICSKDCASKHTCTTISGYNYYNVCLTDNVVPEASVNRLIFPGLSGVINWLGTVVPTLADAATTACSLPSVIDGVGSIVGPIVGPILGPVLG